MRKFYLLTACILVLVFSASAQFSGAYAPVNWTLSTPAPSNGSVNTGGAPASITLTGSNGGNATNVFTDYTISATASGTWSFNWSYHTNDSDSDPQYDLAGVLINGAFTQLSNNAGGIDQSGSFSTTVSAGSIIGFRINATDNIFGNATFTISNFVQPNAVLPVKLSGFTARQQDKKVWLQWSATEEINVSHYEVERSADGQAFTKLGQMAGGSPSLQYSFEDAAPLAGMNYYRLRMVDQDGSFSYSNILPVKFAATASISIYPNPASKKLWIQLPAGQAGGQKLQVFSASGKLLYSSQQFIGSGQAVSIDIASLPKGVYYLSLPQQGFGQSFIKE